MQTKTLLLIFVAAILAIAIAFFQYYFNIKRKVKISFLLSLLRFLALFGIFLLLINPKFTKNEFIVEKANLVILTDNSSSIESAKNDVSKVLKKMNDNAEISEKFTISNFIFGTDLLVSDSVSFTEKNTNISKALAQLKAIYADTKTAVVLLTDGNQTIGEDYGFLGNRLKYATYPIAIGDTTQYDDVQISTINTNKFAFLKNKYPVEIGISYTGDAEIATTVTVAVNGKIAYRENINLSQTNNVKTVNTLLNAETVGLKNISISVSPISNERNTKNNIKNSVVEVIDEKTNIAIISDLMHPDIGALKKAIESNEQRSVQVKKPGLDLKELDDIDVFILYQPTPSFSNIYSYLQKKKASAFTIIGEDVDANFVNRIQKTYRVDGNYPAQETFPVLNAAFTKFDITQFSIDGFPPLNYGGGLLDYGAGEALLQMQIMGKVFESPMLFALDNENGKEVVLLGENIWKWRMQSFRNSQNFENFDDFIGKLMLYLASNKTKSRLNLDHESIYSGTNNAKIKASYFDEAFVFDADATLVLKLKNTSNGNSSEIPMLLKNNFYEVDLSHLPPARYSFTVTVESENRSKSGSFIILDFDIEQQFSETDYKKLMQLATNTGGALYFPDQIESLLTNITDDQQFVPTQKSTKNVVSLIDFRILLGLIIAALSAEWFIRKYNGLT